MTRSAVGVWSHPHRFVRYNGSCVYFTIQHSCAALPAVVLKTVAANICSRYVEIINIVACKYPLETKHIIVHDGVGKKVLFHSKRNANEFGKSEGRDLSTVVPSLLGLGQG